MGRDRTIYLNPYTGAVTGEPSKGVLWALFLKPPEPGTAGSRRAKRRKYVPFLFWDAANVYVFFTVLSRGRALWWPKQFTWRHLRPIVWFRRRLSGKARDFNWHNAIGLWTSIPLTIIVLTRIILSYKWANDLVYHMTGEPTAHGDAGRTDG